MLTQVEVVLAVAGPGARLTVSDAFTSFELTTG
jgi:hypothetical protein